jgi:hypothetical protein
VRLRALRWSYCAFITAAGVTAAASALHGQGEGSHAASMILTLAVAETIAVIALAIERVDLVASAALLLVYFVAGAPAPTEFHSGPASTTDTQVAQN